ncbi:hypothetical protein DRO49_04275 [Candidatus Bathyarchaeota archaeon]|nr:MAG: hypothetical protein DRO49_04275 [Candidatus Bathyarchaeota archaeon]
MNTIDMKEEILKTGEAAEFLNVGRATITIEKTLKFKLIPLTKNDKRELQSLLNDYTDMLQEALDLIMTHDVRTRKKAHELCYAYLRSKFPHLHNKFIQEAYKRALAMYKSYRKLMSKWRRSPKKGKPSPPKVENNCTIELHIDTFRLEKEHSILTIKGNNRIKFLVMEYEYAVEELHSASIKNSKVVVGDSILLLLTIRKQKEVGNHENKIFIDLNEDTVDCLFVDYGKKRAVLFTIKHDIRRIRMNYRRINKRIEEKVKGKRKKLLGKYGKRERKRVEDRLKKITTLLAEVGNKVKADLVREELKDMRDNSITHSRQLNFRLNRFPYRKFAFYADYKFYERGLNVIEVEPKDTSITCPICGHKSKSNRVSKEEFRCKKCGFEFNAQYVAALNLFSRFDDGEVTIRGGRLCLATRKAGSVVPVDEASDEVLIQNDALRGKPVQKLLQIIGVTEVAKI